MQPGEALRRALPWCELGLVFALTVVWGMQPLAHDDLFWHLRTGEKIVSDLRVPREEPFSHTMKGAPWTTHEWGFELLVYATWRAGGVPGLVALQAMLALGIVALIWLRSRSASNRHHPFALLVLWTGVQAAAPNMTLRAALVGTLFLATMLWLLERFRQNGRSRNWVGILVVVLLWANLHASVVFGILILGCFAFAHLVSRSSRRWAYVALLFCAMLVTLLNPNSIDLWLYPVRLNEILYRSGVEFHMGIFSPSTLDTHPWFFALAALCLLVPLSLRRVEGLVAGEALSALFFLPMAFRSNRFIFDFVVLSVPMLMRLLESRQRSSFFDTDRRRMVADGLLLGAIAGSLTLAWNGRERGLVDPRFPESAVRLIREESIPGKLYNSLSLGGYLMWMLHEAVFWHGENVLFFPLQRQVFSLPFSEAMRRHGIDVAILDAQDYERWRSSIAASEWGLVYWDDSTAVYLRRAPQMESVMAAHEYKHLGPFGDGIDLALVARSEGASRAAFAEFERAVRDNPGAQSPHYFAGLLHLQRHEFAKAREALETSLRIRPNPQVESALELLARRSAQ